MARSRVDDTELRGAVVRQANRFGVSNQTLGATYAIPPGGAHVQLLDANGSARNVTLPANPRKGDFFWIGNTSAGAFALTIQDSAGGALVPAASIAQGGLASFIYSGTSWRHT